MRSVRVLLLCLIAPAVVRADLEVPRDGFEFDRNLTGQGERMNYGPFLSYSLINAKLIPGKGKKDPDKWDGLLLPSDKQTIALRAINVYLGGKYAAAFDTETLGYAAAWSGGFIDLTRTNLNGTKGADLAYLRPPVIFQNTQTPGWSLDGSFKDPRPIAFGALPKNIAHYNGLYVSGWKTVLSYTVGDTPVLDLPSMLVKDKAEVFCRTMRIGPSKSAQWLFICDLPGGKGSVIERQAMLTRGDVVLRAALVGAPFGVSMMIADGNKVIAKLPPHDRVLTMRVLIGNGLTNTALNDIIKESGEPEDLTALCKGGLPRWKEELATTAVLGSDDKPYTIDRVTQPDKNPWNSWLRPGGFDFFGDGRAAICMWNGDVWIVSGLKDFKKLTWKRFATGLFEPMGLKIVDDVIYVLGRDQITRLHDLNKDGEADFYENFNNDGPTAPSFHSFALELHTDSKGNFYYVRGAHRIQEGTPMHGGVIKVAKDGSKAELICHGIREADGMSIGPEDTITIADNQGNWVPTSRIDIVKPGAYFGYRWGFKEYPKAENPLCWIPYTEDNSSGGQAWVPDDRWGPMKGKLVHTSFGACRLFQVFVQRDGDRAQGGIVRFPLEFDTGIHRARFNPHDGQLYVCGLIGWGTTAKADGGFFRVRYTGKPVTQPINLRVSKDRVSLYFAVNIDPASLKDAVADVEQWTYDWSEKYGSKDYSIINPGKLGRDKVSVSALSLSEDGKTVHVALPGLKPVMQMGITLKGLKSKDGAVLDTTVYNTINYIP